MTEKQEKITKQKSSTNENATKNQVADASEKQKSANSKSLIEQLSLVQIGIPLAKYLGAAFLVWMVGKMGFSYQWVFIASLIVVFWMRNREKKAEKKSTGKAINSNEEKAVEARVEDIPSWVRQ